MKKIIILSSILVFFITISIGVVLNYKTIRHLIPHSIKEKLPASILNFHENIMVPLQNRISSMQHPYFFYNVVFLPETNFTQLNIKRLSVKSNENSNDPIFSESKTKYYLDLYKENIFVTTYDANIFYFKQNNINNDSEIILSQINSTLNKINPKINILDSYIVDDYIFISGFQYIEEKQKNCKKFRLYKGNLNYKKIIFEEIYNNDQCAFAKFMQAGRIQKYSFDNMSGILFSMGENEIDKPNDFPQDDLSDYGKIIFLDLATNKTQVFSKGHRNPQGLLVEGKNIISTEHGPRGGDEINKIVKGKNYGWPLASYGTYYNTDKKKYLKSHKKYGYVEPVFTYVPAIGISEIIKIPEKFMKVKDLDDLYLISSLNAKSLFLIKYSQ